MEGPGPKKKVNTVRFRYPLGSPRPNEAEFTDFLKKKGVKVEHVEAIYPQLSSRSIFVKFTGEEVMKQYLTNTGFSDEFVYSNGVKIDIRISDANENLTYVRCCEVPPETGDEVVAGIFERFGTVKKITWEKISSKTGFNAYNGIRGIVLDLKEEIPNLVEIDGRQHRVGYDGQKEVCFRCNKEGHKRFQCPLNPQARLNAGRTEAQSGHEGGSGSSYDKNFPDTLKNNNNTAVIGELTNKQHVVLPVEQKETTTSTPVAPIDTEMEDVSKGNGSGGSGTDDNVEQEDGTEGRQPRSRVRTLKRLQSDRRAASTHSMSLRHKGESAVHTRGPTLDVDRIHDSLKETVTIVPPKKGA